MKQVILFAIISASLFSCAPPAEKTQSENLALVKKFMEAVENKDTTTMASLLADNYEGFGPSVGDSTNREDALNNFKYNADNLYESVKYTHYHNIPLTVTAGSEVEPGDWVSNWAYLTIKYKDGRGPVNLWVNAVYRIENGKIVHSRTFYNEADVLRQLGYTAIKPNE
jgi:limonene-1,2-epoxide hydrolase